MQDLSIQKPRRAEGKLLGAVILSSIVEVFHILSFLLGNFVLGILLCVGALGLYRRMRWAGYLSGSAAALLGCKNLLELFVSTVALVIGTANTDTALHIYRALLWSSASLATVILIYLSWSQLGSSHEDSRNT